MVKIYTTTAILMFMLVLNGCASKPTHLDLVIKSHYSINNDSDNIPSPLMLNFYELDSAEQFSKLDYWVLLDNVQDLLNTELISQNKHVIVPNEEQRYKILFDEKTKFLGIIGNFRVLDENTIWRHVINLKQGEHNSVELEIDGYIIKEVD